LVFASSKIEAQFIQFSQYYANPTVLAPSFAGSIPKSRVNFSYRDQWGKIKPSVFITYAAGYDINVPRISSGFGVLILRDIAGAGNLGRTEVGILYSWYGLIDKTQQIYIRPGLNIKLTQRALDFHKLVFGDQINPDGTPNPVSIQPPPSGTNKTFLDATGSFLVYSPKFWTGVTLDHLFMPNDAFYSLDYRVPMKLSLFGGYKFKLGAKGRGGSRSSKIEDWFFVSGYFRYQSNAMQFDIGGYWQHDPFSIGLWFRGLPYLNAVQNANIDAIIFVVGYQIYNFNIGYSYDMTVSPILSRTGGSHEISISYKFDSNLNSKKRYGPVPCPNF